MFAKMNEILPGDLLVSDAGFTCLKGGEAHKVESDDGGLFIKCSHGHHYLDGQENEAGECVGLFPFKAII